MFPHETFDPICSPTTEQIERIRQKWFIPSTGRDDTCQPVDTRSYIRIPTDDGNFFVTGRII